MIKFQVQVLLTVKWPEMSPSDGYRLDSKNLNDITFMLGLRGSWPTEWGNDKNFRDQTDLLLNEVNDSHVTDFKITYEEINKNKVFNKDLDLYEVVYSRGGEKIAKHVYWQEVEGKGVGIVIGGQNMFSGKVECKLKIHVPDYGFNTSYLWISFHGKLLPHWQQLQRDSLKLIESFKVAEK